MHAERGDRVFLKKWPGLITAFDALFKDVDRPRLEARMHHFFEVAGEPNDETWERETSQLAQTLRITRPEDVARLRGLVEQARRQHLRFEEGRMERTVTGSAPNSACWYPNAGLRAWLYYEPRLNVPRNVNPGRDPGWGTMSQWRPSESHGIIPKLIFTTGREPEYGLKAFVVRDRWMVKLHGGTRQQFHYTGLHNPLRPDRLDRAPNNLGEEALSLWRELRERGHDDEALMLYVAGIYNSDTSEDYLEQGGNQVLRIPCGGGRVAISDIIEVVQLSRELRDLHWICAELEEHDDLESEFVEHLGNPLIFEALEFERLGLQAGRFRRREIYRPSAQTLERLAARITTLQERLDGAVAVLYA
jgi:hypothetical protein